MILNLFQIGSVTQSSALKTGMDMASIILLFFIDKRTMAQTPVLLKCFVQLMSLKENVDCFFPVHVPLNY